MNHEFKTRTSLKDYRAFSFWHSYMRTNPILLFISSAVTLAMLPLLYYFYLLDGDMFSLGIFIFCSAVLFIVLILFPIIIFFSTKSIYDSDKFLQEEQTITIDENQITIATRSSTFNVEWKELYKGVETKRHFFLYIAKVKAIVIPKEQINAQGAAFIREQLSKWNKTKAKPRH